MLYYSAILNGIAAPALIFFIVTIANNRTIMGKYTNDWISNSLGLGIGIIMSLCIALLFIFR